MVGLWTWMHRGPTDTSVTLSYYACGRRLVASLLTVKRFHPALVIPCTNRTPPWVLANDYVGCGDSGPGGYKSVWAELRRTEMTRYAAPVPRDGSPAGRRLVTRTCRSTPAPSRFPLRSRSRGGN